MTKTEAHHILKMFSHSIRDRNLFEAMQFALHALSWECAHEKMLGFTTVEEMNDKKESINEN